MIDAVPVATPPDPPTPPAASATAASAPAPASTTAELATRLGMVAAPIGLRSWAYLIDLMVVGVLLAPVVIGILMRTGGDDGLLSLLLVLIGGALVVLFTVIQLVMHGRRGVTVGKASMRLRSVRTGDFTRPGFWRIVLRALVLSVSGIVPVIGPLVLLTSNTWDRTGQSRSVLDRVAGIRLLDVRAGIDPFDATQLRRARRALEAPEIDVSEHLPSLATVPTADRPVLDERRSSAGIVGVSRETWSERIDAAAYPAASFAPPAPDPTTPFLVFEDGSTVAVPATGLIGRMPEAPAGSSVDTLLTLDDPQRLLSKTHLAFGAVGDRVWVRDQGSSNGTALVAGDGSETPLAAGVTVTLEPGTVVRVGSRMFQVRAGQPAMPPAGTATHQGSTTGA